MRPAKREVDVSMKARHATVLSFVTVALATATVYLCCAPPRAFAADAPGGTAASKAISREAALYWERYRKLETATPAPSPATVDNRRLDEVEKLSRTTAARFKTVCRALEDATDRYERLLKRTEAVEKSMASRLNRLETTVGSAADALDKMAKHVDALDNETTAEELARIRDQLTSLREQTTANAAARAKAQADALKRDANLDKALRDALSDATRHRLEYIEQNRAVETRLGRLETGASNSWMAVGRLAEELTKLPGTNAVADIARIDKALTAHRAGISAHLQDLRRLNAKTETQDRAQDQRLDEIEASAKTLRAALAARPSPSPIDTKALSELAVRVSAVEKAATDTASRVARMTGLRKDVADLQEKSASREQALGIARTEAQKRDEALDRRLTLLYKQVASLPHEQKPPPAPEPVLSKVELAALRARLSNMEKTSEGLASATTEMKKAMAASGERPDTVHDEDLQRLERKLLARFAPIEVSLGETREAVSGIGKHLTKNSVEVGDLKAVIDRLSKDLAEMAEQSDDIRQLRKTADTLEADMRKRIASLERDRRSAALTVPEKAPREVQEKQDPPEVADLITRARIIAGQGDVAQAEELFRQALEKREKALGSEDGRVAASLTDLGLLMLGIGRLSEAELYLVRALGMYRRLEGEEHQHVGTALNNVAKLREKQGNLPEAASLYQHAIETFEKALGSRHAYVATTLSNLGMLLRQQKDFEGGEDALKRCLKIREHALDKSHPKVAETLNNLALLYMDWDRAERCEPLFERALEIYRNAYGRDHASVSAILGNMAAFYAKTGEQAKAAAYRALARQPRAEGR